MASFEKDIDIWSCLWSTPEVIIRCPVGLHPSSRSARDAMIKASLEPVIEAGRSISAVPLISLGKRPAIRLLRSNLTSPTSVGGSGRHGTAALLVYRLSSMLVPIGYLNADMALVYARQSMLMCEPQLDDQKRRFTTPRRTPSTALHYASPPMLRSHGTAWPVHTIGSCSTSTSAYRERIECRQATSYLLTTHCCD
jgi:hypothetical protein